jgi:hypothetical protein
VYSQTLGFVSESLDELTEMVVPLFTQTTNHNITIPEWTKHPYGPDQVKVCTCSWIALALFFTTTHVHADACYRNLRKSLSKLIYSCKIVKCCVPDESSCCPSEGFAQYECVLAHS